jgi:hypothetical protein
MGAGFGLALIPHPAFDGPIRPDGAFHHSLCHLSSSAIHARQMRLTRQNVTGHAEVPLWNSALKSTISEEHVAKFLVLERISDQPSNKSE